MADAAWAGVAVAILSLVVAIFALQGQASRERTKANNRITMLEARQESDRDTIRRLEDAIWASAGIAVLPPPPPRQHDSTRQLGRLEQG